MTPENITAILAGIAVVLTALAGLLGVIIPAIKKIKTDVGEIRIATNGATEHQEKVKRALEEKVDRLQDQLVEVIVSAREAAEAARQSAADVRAERAAPSRSAATESGS